MQSNIDEGTWSSLDHTVAWNGEQQQYNWTDLNGGQHSTTSRPADEEVQPRDKKPTEPPPPTTADGWIPTLGQASVLKHPTRTFYWDTKKHVYTWIDTDGNRHVDAWRPPDDQVKKEYSATADDDD